MAGRILVGDIGGTNARFAVARFSDRPILDFVLSLKSAEFESLEAAIDGYLRLAGIERPRCAVMAVAGPVTDGTAKLTNLSWQVSEAGLKRLGFADTALINDFRALAAAAEGFDADDVTPIGGHDGYDPTKNVAILGAGTGLGTVSYTHLTLPTIYSV